MSMRVKAVTAREVQGLLNRAVEEAPPTQIRIWVSLLGRIAAAAQCAFDVELEWIAAEASLRAQRRGGQIIILRKLKEGTPN